MNTKLLTDKNVESDFSKAWDTMLTVKNKYKNVNEWWEKSAKLSICSFFKNKGREESRLQRGLLKYLEIKLNRLYKDFHQNGNLNLAETKRLKSKINNIKENIMEGVTIRARIKEQTEGEKASSTLLSKQVASKSKPKMCKILTEYPYDSYPNKILESQETISEYVTNYYERLYDKGETDIGKQAWFLSFIENCISDSDNEALTAKITDDEIYDTLISFSTNKSPGIDGIPVEFYTHFFHIIKHEFCEIIRNSFKLDKLTDSQRKAIVILLFKGGDHQLLSSWRPISLICVDTKLVAKIIANRIKPLMDQCISNEQYCSNNKSIIECNNVTRDMIYYINDRNETGALVNIDLKKAFDSVDHLFLFAVLEKNGILFGIYSFN